MGKNKYIHKKGNKCINNYLFSFFCFSMYIYLYIYLLFFSFLHLFVYLFMYLYIFYFGRLGIPYRPALFIC